MRTRMASSIVLALCVVGAVARAEVGAGQGGSGGASATDSPYKNGPPPITGGYTDTSQGGAKGSGDPAALPPNVGAAAAQRAAKPNSNTGTADAPPAPGSSTDTSKK